MAEKNSNLYEFTKGIIKQNPTLVTLLGMCPTLAVTTMAKNGIGMGLATTFVLVCSNFVISLLKNVIPKAVRLPCFIVIIAGFVTLIEFLMKGYIPELYSALGVFLSLITVNCIILGRAEAFASKNKIFPSILDGLGMGLGFTLSLFTMGSIREILGTGSWFGFKIPFLCDSVHHAGRRIFRAWLSYCTCEQDSEQEAAKGDILLRLPKCGFVQGSVQNRE